jgi:hypothetical protein
VRGVLEGDTWRRVGIVRLRLSERRVVDAKAHLGGNVELKMDTW